MKSSEDQVATDFRRGSPPAVEAVRRRVRRILRFRRYGMTAADREDLEQEVMAQLWRAVNRAEFDASRFWGFVEVVTARRAIDWLRAKRDEKTLDREPPAESGDPQRAAIAEERRRRVAAAFAELDEPCRRLLRLRVVEGLSYRQAASTLGRSEGALRVQYLRCVAKIRERLEESAVPASRRERDRS